MRPTLLFTRILPFPVLLLGMLLLAGCVAVPEPSGPPSYPPSRGPGPGPWYPPPQSPAVRLVFFPAVIDFGRVPEGSASTVEVRVRNDGENRVRVGRVTLEGRFFSLAAEGCTGAWLSPGRSCTLGVAFFPERPGSYDGSVAVVLDEPYGRRLTLPLRGEAERSRFPDVRVEPGRLEFGDLEPGDRLDRRVEVRNNGRADLAVKGVSVDGQGFSRREDSCTGRTLSPGRSCGVTVRFIPPVRGSFSGVLGVTSNDPDDRLVNVPLTGTGKSTRFPDIRVSPGRLDFGEVTPGGAHVLEAEVRNQGNDELAIREVSVDGLGFSKAADGCSERRIAPGRACTMKVAFRPGSPGSFSGVLGIVSNDPDERLVSVDLRGSAPRTAPPPPPCPVEELRPFRGRDADEPLLLTGSMRRDACVTYAFKVQKKGVLTVCTPPGYSLSGEGFSLVPDEPCTLPKDKTVYRTWRKVIRREEAQTGDLTINREARGPQDYKFLFSFAPEEDRPGRRD